MEVARVWDAWQGSGRLTTFGAGYAKLANTPPEDLSPPAPTSPLHAPLKSFLLHLKTRGADADRLMATLLGHEASKINLFFVYNQWRRWHALVRTTRARRSEVDSLLRVYRRLDWQIMRDPGPSLFLKAAWARERTILRFALGLLCSPAPARQRRPLSRQGFWTPVIVALVNHLTEAGWTRRRAYRDVARLLHLAFPAYPDQPEPVKQRYLRARRDPSSWRRRVRVNPDLLLVNPIGDGKDYGGGEFFECPPCVAKGLIRRGWVKEVEGPTATWIPLATPRRC